jgi:hypothetical protein
MSAIGSLIIIPSLLTRPPVSPLRWVALSGPSETGGSPARLYHTRQIAFECLLTEANTAHIEAPHIPARAAANAAAMTHLHSILAPLFPVWHTRFGH